MSAPSASGPAVGRLPLYKRFLKIENHRLRLAHQAGGGGRKSVGGAWACSTCCCAIFSPTPAGTATRTEKRRDALPAMLAIGGYGRGELNPHSDVDILFLHDHKPDATPPATNELIKQVLYVLWDIGFKVGPRHALHPRSVRPRQRR